MSNLLSFPEYRFIDLLANSIPQDYCNRLSEKATLYSARSEEELKLERVPETGKEALQLIISYWILLPVDADYQRSIILNKIGKLAHSKQYQGSWSLIQEILLLPEDEPFDVWSILSVVVFSNYSFDDIFGNLVPQCKKIIRRMIGQRRYPLVLRKLPKVNKPQRKRGYDDHGSRVEPHRSGRNIISSGPNPIRQDYQYCYPTTKPTSRMWIPQEEKDS